MNETTDLQEGALVQLIDPDGNVFEFQYVATLENLGKRYVLLSRTEEAQEEDEEAQMVIVRVQETADGLAQYVLPREDEAEDVYARYFAMQVMAEEAPALLQ